MKVKKKFLTSLRYEYVFRQFDEKQVEKTPFEQFDKWFSEAVKAKVADVNGMVLATASRSSKPSSRVVLLKGFDESGFVFFTNYNSRKGKMLAENPFASLTFYWHELARQVHIEGKVKKISAKESDEYFQSRPRGSQTGANVSPQSQIIPSRIFLEKAMQQLTIKFGDKKIPRPVSWGGYVLIPNRFEFWQGRENRLHDRILYTQQKSRWKIHRLAP